MLAINARVETKLDNTCRARWPRRGSCVVGDQNWTHETSITAREAALFGFIFGDLVHFEPFLDQ